MKNCFSLVTLCVLKVTKNKRSECIQLTRTYFFVINLASLSAEYAIIEYKTIYVTKTYHICSIREYSSIYSNYL